jgi:hypothetical protein
MRVQARELRLKPKDRAMLEARPCDDDARARYQAGSDCSVGGRGSEHAIDSASRRGGTWGCQHLAASVFADHGLEGLKDQPRPGKKPSYTVETDKRIRQVLDERPPAGYARWTGPLIADRLGDVPEQHVWRVLREQKIDLAGRKSWCESNDPEFAAKGGGCRRPLYGAPENALVICVDEKPSIQALERAQGYLKLANGRTLTGHRHDYKRNGTSRPTMKTLRLSSGPRRKFASGALKTAVSVTYDSGH